MTEEIINGDSGMTKCIAGRRINPTGMAGGVDVHWSHAKGFRKLKRPDGKLCEEFHTATVHYFQNGELDASDSDADGGSYTGRFWFEFKKSGRITKLYTTDTAPKWLLALYHEVAT